MFWSTIFACLVLVENPVAQGEQEKILGIARYDDGSEVKFFLGAIEVPVKTKYGLLKIPVQKIKSVQVGLHYPEGAKERISESLVDIGSPKFKVREVATQALISLGPYAILDVRECANSLNPEISRRAQIALREILKRYPEERLRERRYDLVTTPEFTTRGTIELKKLPAYSPYFGKVELNLSRILSLSVYSRSEIELTLEAEHYGRQDSKWFDTGFDLRMELQAFVSASGWVDLTPYGSERCNVGPFGHTLMGKGGKFTAGSLVGRIGTDGTPFLIGSHDRLPLNVEGRLYLQITANPWDTSSGGRFLITIRRR